MICLFFLIPYQKEFRGTEFRRNFKPEFRRNFSRNSVSTEFCSADSVIRGIFHEIPRNFIPPEKIRGIQRNFYGIPYEEFSQNIIPLEFFLTE